MNALGYGSFSFYFLSQKSGHTPPCGLFPSRWCVLVASTEFSLYLLFISVRKTSISDTWIRILCSCLWTSSLSEATQTRSLRTPPPPAFLKTCENQEPALTLGSEGFHLKTPNCYLGPLYFCSYWPPFLRSHHGFEPANCLTKLSWKLIACLLFSAKLEEFHLEGT